MKNVEHDSALETWLRGLFESASQVDEGKRVKDSIAKEI